MNPALKEAGTERPVVDEAAAGGVMSTSPAVLVLGPVPCISCKRAVSWWRIGGLLRLVEGARPFHGWKDTPHRCPASEAAA